MSQQSSATETGLLGIDDPDEAIYRMFPVWFFEQALSLRQIVLVPPWWWEDPYEILASLVMVAAKGNPRDQVSLAKHLRPAYAQCWSRTNGCDTLLRAYSRVVKDPHNDGRNTCPRDEGVRVRSTPRKLLQAVRAASSRQTFLQSSWFVGAVHYLEAGDIHHYVGNRIRASTSMKAVGEGQSRAKLMLMKRKEFEHEAEVRLIYVEERQLEKEESLIRVQIEPNEVFDELMYDPRLSLDERRRRQCVAQDLGYKGKFFEPLTYQRKTALIVVVDRFPGEG